MCRFASISRRDVLTRSLVTLLRMVPFWWRELCSWRIGDSVTLGGGEFEQAVRNDMAVVGEDNLWKGADYLGVAHNSRPVHCVLTGPPIEGITSGLSRFRELAGFASQLSCLV